MGIVMSRLQGDMEKYVKENSGGLGDQVIKVDIDAGTGW